MVMKEKPNSHGRQCDEAPTHHRSVVGAENCGGTELDTPAGNSSFGTSTNQTKASSRSTESSSSSSSLLLQEKRYLAYPKSKQKNVAMKAAALAKDNTDASIGNSRNSKEAAENAPSTNHDADQLTSAKKELKSEAKKMDGTGHPINTSDAVEAAEKQTAKNYMLDRSDSFNILSSVVPERASTSSPGTTTCQPEKLAISSGDPGGGSMEETTSPDIFVSTRYDTSTTSAVMPPSLILQDVDNANNDLLEAVPVEKEYHSSHMMEAQPIDQEALEKREEAAANYKRWTRLGIGFIVAACIILIVSLAIGLTKKRQSSVVVADSRVVPTPSPEGPLPAMDNLELLYSDLSEETKESLHDKESPQYQAWEWLLNHPNITTYPEWRKKQIFALCTFYHAMEGPKWPIPIRKTWVDYSLSECSWINTSPGLMMGFSIQYLQTDSYDFRPCNDEGALQTIAMMNMQLGGLKPFIPPEISLLSSLSILILLSSGIEARLEELLPQAVIQLPRLSLLVMHDNQLTGTIPTQISATTSIRHLLIGQNKLSGSMPAELGALTALEYLGLGENILTGNLPSQLGLMTKLSQLEPFQNSLSGSLPSELAAMGSMETLGIYRNPSITGHIPSELGLLSNARLCLLYDNSLSGSIPRELAMLTKLTTLSVSTNPLSGLVPTQLGSLTSLSSLYLFNNKFTGKIPSELGLLAKLVTLGLSGNSLTGHVPTELGSLTNLLYLTLFENRLTGRIPTQLGLLSDLVRFSVSHNKMTGSIPSELGLIRNMTSLWFKNNTLFGSIPTELWQLSQLKAFSVSDLPEVSGIIPEFLCPLQENDCRFHSSTIGTDPTYCRLEFDCLPEKLCGCDCSCVGTATSEGTMSGEEGNRSSSRSLLLLRRGHSEDGSAHDVP